jgi:hypothetical protein
MGQMAVDLFFADPQRLGQVPPVHGRCLQQGDHSLSECFHVGQQIDMVQLSLKRNAGAGRMSPV